MSDLEQLIKENAKLKEELEIERNKRIPSDINNNYVQLYLLLRDGDYTIMELAEHLMIDQRTVSQWLYQLKQRYGAKINISHEKKRHIVEKIEAIEVRLAGKR